MRNHNYSTMSNLEFFNLLEQGQAHKDPDFYNEFLRRTQGGRTYDPSIDPHAWEKSTAALLEFMDREGLPYKSP